MAELEKDTQINIYKRKKKERNWLKDIFEGAGAIAFWIIVIGVVVNLLGN